MSSIPLTNPTGEGNLKWFALYTRHQHEKTVAGLLEEKGLEVFLPLYPAIHRWKDRYKKLLLPLYPGYVFLRDRLDWTLPVLATPGIHWIVGTAAGPQPIPEFEIDAIKRLTSSSLVFEPHPFLNCGDRVRVAQGPLEGVDGILLRKKNAFRLVLSVELLMKSVAVEIDAWMIERVSSGTLPRAVFRNATELRAEY